MSSQKYVQDLETSSSGSTRQKGITISTGLCAVAVLLAVVLATLVGLIVHFAENQKIECVIASQPETPLSRPQQMSMCRELAKDGSDLCNACPTTFRDHSTRPPGTPDIKQTTTPKPQGHTRSTTETPSTTPKPKPIQNMRLPTSVVPSLYNVRIRSNMYEEDPQQFNFTGTVNITIKCQEPTDSVTLHMYNITVLKVTFTGAAGSFNVDYEIDLKRQFLILKLDRDMEKGQTYTVNVDFWGQLKKGMKGLYLSSYKRGNETVYLTTSQFEATDARRAFPCFDEPGFKSEFNIILERKKNRWAISNMPVERTENMGNGWVADHFQTTPKMSTYLLAMIVCDFNYTERVTSRNVTYRAWARPEAVAQTEYALNVGVEVLTYYEDYFNITYPLPKLDMIAIPDFAAGAMENWGLITYRETAMLYDPKQSSEGNKQRVAIVVSHELAHQWFGNLVSPVWWDEIWLNEGFASYMEYVGTDYKEPAWKMFQQFLLEDMYRAFGSDGLVSSHPVFLPLTNPAEILSAFDSISYSKAGSVIRMAQFFMGEDTFKKGLTKYLSGLKYGSASHDDLWYAWGNQSLIDHRSRTDVKTIMDTWVLQMNYPLVTVRRTPNGLSVTQERFLLDPKAKDSGEYTSEFGYKWEIPFTYTYEGETDYIRADNTKIHWMKKKDIGIDNPTLANIGKDKWILANLNQYGFYRVNYDKENWKLLIQQLKDNHTVIPSNNRAQILNDAWNLARSGSLDMGTALDVLDYLGDERDYVPWDAALSQLSFVDSMLERHELYGEFQAFMTDKLKTYFKELTMNNTGASHLMSYKRSLISSEACNFGIQSCIQEAKTLYQQWMDQPDINPIDPGVRSTVYCTAIRHGGAKEWNFANQQQKLSNIAGEKSKLRYGMTCSEQTWILYRYLENTMNPDEIRKQDVMSTVVRISRNTIGRPLVWDFVRSHWNHFMDEFSEESSTLSRMLVGITSTFNTEFDLQQLLDFQKSHPDMGSATRAMAQAIEHTKSNIEWMKTNIPPIRSWLQAKVTP